MNDQKKEIILNELEEQQLREGQALYEMTKNSPGFQIIKKWFEDLSYHSWIDPRETKSKEEWEWQELNAFHAANNAAEVLERIQQAISQSEYLAKVKSGDIKRNTGMQIK